jgi:hypothetical protein
VVTFRVLPFTNPCHGDAENLHHGSGSGS